jgi:hypothetical protein
MFAIVFYCISIVYIEIRSTPTGGRVPAELTGGRLPGDEA